MDVPDQPETIYVIKRFTVEYTQDDVDSWVADIWDGDNYLGSWRGEDRNEARKEAVAWVYDTYDVPLSIEMINDVHRLCGGFHQPEELDVR